MKKQDIIDSCANLHEVYVVFVGRGRSRDSRWVSGCTRGSCHISRQTR